ncbi:MAG: hypothetical protein JW940_05390 [Polyangiaceae bacterium]|nr:hypothetical protein [Polyangiaceae bacterium]
MPPDSSRCVSTVAEDTGDALFKVVMFGYAGVVNAAERFYGSLPVDRRIDWFRMPENDGWSLSRATFRPAPGFTFHGRRVSLQLWAHEGTGFIGQPGSAKDTVFKGATGIIAVATAEDAKDLGAVLEAEITRVFSRGGRPNVLFCAPSTAGLLDAMSAVTAAKARDALSLIATREADCLRDPAIAISAIARDIEQDCR